MTKSLYVYNVGADAWKDFNSESFHVSLREVTPEHMRLFDDTVSDESYFKVINSITDLYDASCELIQIEEEADGDEVGVVVHYGDSTYNDSVKELLTDYVSGKSIYNSRQKTLFSLRTNQGQFIDYDCTETQGQDMYYRAIRDILSTHMPTHNLLTTDPLKLRIVRVKQTDKMFYIGARENPGS